VGETDRKELARYLAIAKRNQAGDIMIGQQGTAAANKVGKTRPSAPLCALLLLLVGCDDPLLDICQTPATGAPPKASIQRETKPAPEPAKKIVPPPVENRSTEPAPPKTSPAPRPPERVTPPPAEPPRAPTTMVSKQVPAETKPAAVEPQLIAIVPSWFEPTRKRTVEPAQAAIQTVAPKPIGERVELLAIPAKARLDQTVVAVARLLGPDGQPITDAEIEFAIDRSGVGVITAAGGKEDPEARQFRRSSTLARCRTSLTTYTLDRKGIADESITIRPGDAWCILQSPSPGDLVLSAHSVDVVHAERCQVVHRMHWYEAELDLAKEIEVLGGELANLAPRVLNQRGEVLAGYPVRFEIVDNTPAGFTNNAKTIERSSDSSGTASTSVRPNSDQAGTSKVRVQLFGRPIIPGPATLLDDRTIDVRWTSVGSASLDVRAPETAAVGSVVNIQTTLGNRTNKNVRGRIVALVGSGTEVISQLAEGRDEAGLRFALAEVGDERTGPITDLAITSREPGERRVRVEWRDGEKVHAAKEVAIRFIQPRLAMEKSFPDRWRVGERSEYTIRVKNVGDVAADQVTVEDEIPAGIRVESTDGVKFVDRVRWEIARLAPGEETVVRASAVPEKSFQRLAVRAWADDKLSQKVETFDVLNVAGVETVEVTLADVADPVPLAGEALYDVEIVNRGSAPAEAIVLSAELSSHLRPTSATGSWSASVRDGRLELGTIDRMNPGERLIVRVRAQAIADGDARVTVSARHPSLGPAGVIQQEATRVYKP
jgi:uncharacterized repeat protein (TIGR01451 family)